MGGWMPCEAERVQAFSGELPVTAQKAGLIS